MKILVIIGTRPEAIKMAPVVIALRALPAMEVILCVSGQHGEMLNIVLADFDLQPDIILPAPPPAPNLSILTAHLIQSISPLLEELSPDWLLVQGDTTTVMASALAAFYGKVKIGHVEAGLRSFDKLSPFPEEVNRCITATLANIHFAPTEKARQNLLREGICEQTIHVTGNTVVDALLHMREQIKGCPELLPDSLREALSNEQEIVLVTCHRRENFGTPLHNICAAVTQLAANYPKYTFVWPVHRNPNVYDVVSQAFMESPNVLLLPPLSYKGLLAVLNHATLALSDSGGIQEEAPSFGVPVLVLRDTTERPEGIESGVAQLVGANSQRIYEESAKILDAQPHPSNTFANPYGDGHAGTKIAHIIAKQ